ncbi:MAG: cobyric acid synthase [Candidatus Methanoplasma sp.]|jgi:adenosylcobyric acid synthase|nr:cobyric acid synthase [Candidatus Methanoplasma sp.]
MKDMDNITKKVKEEIEKGWIGPNANCPYHPSHFKGQDCTFCYCPFYPCHDEDLGEVLRSKRGSDIWDCTYCLFIHRQEVGKFVMGEIKRLGMTDPKDPRMKDILKEAKERFYERGKAVMVVGATSDAGKSLAVMALCRILQKKGYLISPFKSQNMSLNSTVTRRGYEIAAIQALQSKAAGLKDPDQHMNPILMKPKGDTMSQVIVEGEPYGDYDVKGYYEEFVPGPGREIVKRNIKFLKDRYDIVVMEGAGSPAEINIYDKDIANMGAAKIADASCILIVNVEWGGSFAYAAGTVRLIPEEDRGRIKGIILNNVRGDVSRMVPGAEELEKILGIPVIGIIPHIKLELPLEDSETMRGIKTRGDGKMKISVIKLPKIANFTDFDPLLMEDVTLKYVTEPEELKDSDAIIIPGTKNTINDFLWMKEKGLDQAIAGQKGKVPILGICGGYQMMGRLLDDPEGVGNQYKGSIEGFGFFNNSTRWEKGKKKIAQDDGALIMTGEPVTGYETHAGMTEVNEKPLFDIKRHPSNENEGSFREEELLFGTYIHGVFDRPAFRRFFLSYVEGGKDVASRSGMRDYDDLLEENIERLASAFENNMNMEKLMNIVEGKQ